jgi:hypothetical protein
VRIPDNICLGTLRPTRGQPYSAAAVSALWGGKRIAPVLSFEQKVFAELLNCPRNVVPIIGTSLFEENAAYESYTLRTNVVSRTAFVGHSAG